MASIGFAVRRLWRPGHRPRGAAVGAALEVEAPRARPPGGLRAARADQRAVGEPHRLVLDRAEHAVGQAPGIGPRPPVVARRANHAPPRLRARTDLVEERQRLVRASRTARGSSTGAACHRAGRRWPLRREASTRRARAATTQMPTSGLPSFVPPNHAATSPPFVSTIVEACALGKEAVSYTSSELIRPDLNAAGAAGFLLGGRLLSGRRRRPRDTKRAMPRGTSRRPARSFV